MWKFRLTDFLWPLKPFDPTGKKTGSGMICGFTGDRAAGRVLVQITRSGYDHSPQWSPDAVGSLSTIPCVREEIRSEDQRSGNHRSGETPQRE
jgi:hypothetical protein